MNCECCYSPMSNCDSRLTDCVNEKYDAKMQSIAVLKQAFMCADYGTWAAQGFCSIEKANLMFMSFTSNHKANGKIVCFTVDMGAKTCAETKSFTFECNEDAGQPNCLASVKVCQNKYAVLWSGNDYTDTIYYVIYDASWNTFSEIKAYKGNHTFYNVFSYNDTLQCYGRNANKLCVFDFVYKYTNDALTIMPFVATYLDSIPASTVRTPQTFSGDGQYYYFLASNPNCIAIYNLNGKIVRWVDIGEWAQKTIFIGELEGITFYNGKWYINTQFYHARPATNYDTDTLHRFWGVWEIDFSESCANGYPHNVYSKDVYSVEIDTNIREAIVYQDGSTNHPFGCFDLAFYCGLNNAYYNVNIKYKNGSTEIIENVFKNDNKEYNVNCEDSEINFKSIFIYGGTLRINNADIEACDVGARGVFMASNCNFTSGNDESYVFNGGVFITNGNHSVENDENTTNVIKINSGCYGIIDFVESDYAINSNVNDRTNIRMRGVNNKGRANEWISVYNKTENSPAIGEVMCKITPNRTVLIVCESNGNQISYTLNVRESGFYQIQFLTGSTNTISRTMQFQYDANSYNFKVYNVCEHTIDEVVTVNNLTSGDEPIFFTVKQILVNGFN